jgi:hypothetical protein
MPTRILFVALTVLVFLAAGACTLKILDTRSLLIAELARDSCYASRGYGLTGAGAVPAAVRTACTRPIRDYRSNLIWRAVFAASVGATAAMLLVGGIVILIRRSRSGP